MNQDTPRGSSKQMALFVALLPLLLFGVFYLYTKRARTDVATMVYPEKMFSIGVDTVVNGTYKSIDSIYHEIPDFTFTNQYNQLLSKDDLLNKVIVADFFFTSCPSICPKMSEQLARVQKEFIRDDQVVFLSFTIDPKRDSVAVLKQYGTEYGAVPGKWHFLTGDKEAIYKLAGEGFKLSAQADGGEASHDGFVHSDRLVLVDPDWHIRGYYNGTDIKDVNYMMGDISLIMKEFKR